MTQSCPAAAGQGLHVKVLPHKCIGAGACAQEAPEVFELDDAGMVHVLQQFPAAHLHEKTRAAARACPAAVIVLEERAHAG